MLFQDWHANGCEGREHLSIYDFLNTGRGIKTLRPLKAGDELLTIPGNLLWTVNAAEADPILGPILHEFNPPISEEATLVVYLLFVKSRESGYDERRLHIRSIPTHYTNSVLFNGADLEVCAGSSLYTITIELKKQIRTDYLVLKGKLCTKHPDIFPLNRFTLKRWVCIYLSYIIISICDTPYN